MKNHKLISEGRTITTNDPGLAWLVNGLNARLKEFGDIKGVDGIAQINLSVKDDDLFVQVDRDCEYEGYYNYSSGILSKEACALSLMSMILSDLMWVSIPRKEKPGVHIIDNTGVLKKFYPTARQVDEKEAAGLFREYNKVWDQIRLLPEQDQVAVYRFLD